jgi:hypothetical protein
LNPEFSPAAGQECTALELHSALGILVNEASQLTSSAVTRQTQSRAWKFDGRTGPAAEVVRLIGPRGFCVHGFLIGISNGSLHLNSAVALASGTPVEIAIPSCKPMRGTVARSKPKDTFFQITVFFPALSPLAIQIGQQVWMDQLHPARSLGNCRVLDRTGRMASVICRETAQPGAWVRIDTDSALLYGEVAAILPTTENQCVVGVHVDVALSKKPLMQHAEEADA